MDLMKQKIYIKFNKCYLRSEITGALEQNLKESS